MKRISTFVLAAALCMGLAAGCAQQDGGSAADGGAAGFDSAAGIGVISREDGSGTRGAFIELFGIERKDESGEKVDYTIPSAAVTNSTSVMMTTVAGDTYAIGYVSLGSLNDTVKALEIDGAAASVENIKSGSYKISRPFNIAVKEGLSPEAQDFIGYILSAEGQAVIEANNCIPAGSGAQPYAGAVESGKITISGSSSVGPVMEKLAEAYKVLNPGVTIELQVNDSSTGMANAANGVSDIGMASRELKDSELAQGLIPTTIALDGIAVIVNNSNPVEGLSAGQVAGIYTGEITAWAEVMG